MKFVVPDVFCQFLREQQLPVADLLAETGLAARFADEQITLSPLEYYQLIHALEPYLTPQAILQLCEVANMAQFSAPVYAALVAENGLAALNRLATYKHLIGPVTMTVDEQEDTVALRYTFIYPEIAQLQTAVFFEQLLAVNLLRAGSGQRIVPQTVVSQFRYPPEFTAHFGCAGTAGKDNCIVFAKADVLRPFTSADQLAWGVLAPNLTASLAASDQEDPLMASVQQSMVTNISRADDRLSSVGRSLGISTRTLQREFTQRHTTYKQLLAQTKRMLAVNYVQNFHLPLVEIAYLLGYSEPSAFSRAFRQWTGESFSRYRAAQVH
jgi:AraC-like DNA-binding protein